MAIEDIQTKADLERFIGDRLTDLSVPDISGLPDALAAVGGFQAELVRAESAPELAAEYVDIPGTERTITVGVPGLLLVVATLDIWVDEADTLTATMAFDGVDQEGEAIVNAQNLRAPVTQCFFASLASGDHTLVLRAKKNGATPEIFDETNTGYLYLLIPAAAS